jgi:hypothetical protein
MKLTGEILPLRLFMMPFHVIHGAAAFLNKRAAMLRRVMASVLLNWLTAYGN